MGKEKFIVPKFDFFNCKHIRRKKTTFPCSMFLKILSTKLKIVNMLIINCYIFPSGESVLDKMMQGMAHEGLKKVVQVKNISVVILVDPWLK